MENAESKISINILEVLKDFLQKWWIILIASVVGGASLFVYTLATTKQEYTASSLMYVNNSSAASMLSDAISKVTSSDISANRSLVTTYAVYMKTHQLLEDVLATANIVDENGKQKYTYEQLCNMLTVGSVNNTEFCSITVKCTDPEDAKRLANITLLVFEDQIGEVITGASAKTGDFAVEAKPVSRGFTKRTLIGFIIGFVLSIGVIFVFDFYINDTFQSTDSLKQCLPEDIPVLSVIPDTDTSHSGKYSYYYKKHGHYANDYAYSYYQETVEKETASEEKGEK